MDRAIIFDNYLKGNTTIDEVVVALDCLQEKEIKSKGVIYTPWSIVKEMIKLISLEPEKTVIEPACGHGIFLFGLLEFAKNTWLLNSQELLTWFLTHVKGIEINPQTIDELKQTLSIYFKKQNVIIDNFPNIILGDGLYAPIGKIDICVGNPPYVRTRELDKDYLHVLREKFLSCSKGNVDIYYAFIERYAQLCEKTCLITPNSFIQNDSAKALREIVFPKLSKLIDFREKLIFADARTYTCIFLLDTIHSAFCEYATDIAQPFIIINKQDLIKNLESSSNSINEIYSGLATLADSVYMVKKHQDKYYAYLDEQAFEIEKSILAPYIKITKQRGDDYSAIDFMIYPYHENRTIMKESYLQEHYPKTYAYLLRAKPTLMKRDKGKTQNYEAWYAYGRKQGLHHISTQSIIVIPRMIGGVCVPQKLDISMLQKEYGKFVFTSGYVIPLTQDSESKQCEYKILSQKFMDFCKLNGKVWPGKNEPYYSLSVKQIKKFNGN